MRAISRLWAPRPTATSVPRRAPETVAKNASSSVSMAPPRNFGHRSSTAGKSSSMLIAMGSSSALIGHAVVDTEQGLIAVRAFAVRPRVDILAGDECGSGQRHVQRLRMLLHQPEVLEHQVDTKAGADVASDHRRTELVQHPG